jgi:hypothetical protein
MNSTKEKLCISFSGGRTSAVMTKLCVEQYSGTHDIVITFANTGCEHENTLKFVDQCDKHFGWGVVWLEAVVQPNKGDGIRHKIVNFNTASRKGEPFEAYVAKYGLPGPTHPQCTSRLKEEVMDSYRHRELGWKRGTYLTAIGIRSDEADRMSEKRIEKKFVYPLVQAGWTKEDVKQECKRWPFDLDIKGEHYGNCVWCWKKSLRKLLTLAQEDESVFDFPKYLEEKYQNVRERDGERGGVFNIFRKDMSTKDIIQMSKEVKFTPYKDSTQAHLFSFADYNVTLDTGSACGDSCEVGAD